MTTKVGKLFHIGRGRFASFADVEGLEITHFIAARRLFALLRLSRLGRGLGYVPGQHTAFSGIALTNTNR
jgi:hypothetical protein